MMVHAVMHDCMVHYVICMFIIMSIFDHSDSQDDDNEGVDLSDQDAVIEADDSDIDDSFVGVFVFEEKKRKSFSCLSPSEVVAYPLLLVGLMIVFDCCIHSKKER